MSLDFSKLDLDELEDVSTEARGALSVSRYEDPAQAAEVNKLSRASGLPQQAVKKDLKRVKSDLNFDKIDFNKLQSHRGTSEFLADPNNAAVAKDDIDTLMAYEDESEQHGAFVNGLLRLGERVPALIGALISGASTFAGDRDEAEAEIGKILTQRDFAAGNVSEATVTKSNEVARKVFLGDEKADKFVKEVITDPLKNVDLGSQDRENFDNIVDNFNQGRIGGTLGALGSAAVDEGLATIPDMVATVVALPAYVLARSEEIGQERAKNNNDDFDRDDLVTAAPFALASSLLERILPQKTLAGMGDDAISDIGRGILKTSAERLKKVGVKAAQGVVTEAATEAIQEGVIEYLGETLGTQKEVSLDDATQRAIEAAVIGGTVGGGISGSAETVKQSVDIYSSIRQTAHESEQATIDKINDIAEKSSTRENDPEAFEQFVETSNQTGTKVYVDSESAQEYIDTLTETDKGSELIQRLLDENDAPGGDIAIPLSSFSAYITGTPHYDALRDSMKLSAENYSPKDIKDTEATVEINKKALIEKAERDQVNYQESRQIFDQVTEQLVATGRYSKTNAKVMAELVPAWAAVHARENNISVKEAYDRTGLTILGPDQDVDAQFSADDRGYDSPDVESFRDLFEAAKKASPNGASVELKDDYKGQKVFTTDEGRVGFAVSADGELNSVFKHPDSKLKSVIQEIVPISVAAGATKLTAFDGYLVEQYSKAGFTETSRVPFDPEQAPENWDTESMGTPDVVSMEYTGNATDFQQSVNPDVLAGAPTSANIPNVGKVDLGINQKVVDVAKKYMNSKGMEYQPLTRYAKVDKNRAKRIADEFEKMEHDPKDPAVAAAYDALIKETMDQYDAMLEAGVEIEFVRGEDPYKNSPYQAVIDVRDNNHLYVFSTKDGFGPDDNSTVDDNPLLAETKYTISGETALANDIFRAVHDYFGHAKNGVGFRANGEENAWQAHATMYSPLALRAMTTETRGQNSWLNFGPHGEKNLTAKVEDTIFADQKIGLLPEWVSTEGRIEPERFNQSTALRKGTETLKRFGLDPTKQHKTRDVAAALEARQRKKYGKIDRKDRSDKAARRIADWMVQEIEFEMQSPDSGVGWYTEKFQNALDTFSEVFPELKTDKTARDMMTVLIAVTSDGQKVVPNFRMAAEFYGNYRETGELKSNRGTSRQKSIDTNIERIKVMLDQYGPEGMHEYLMQEDTVSNLKKLAKEAGEDFRTQYKADVTLPRGALILGPKLGAFYANLMGSDGYLTMDRWWTRTFNRYRGDLLDSVNGTADAPTNSKGEKVGLAAFKDLIGEPDISDDQALSKAAELRKPYADRNFKKTGDKEVDRIEASANTIYKTAFENINDAPFNSGDRSFMLAAVDKAVKTLKRKGTPMSAADVQATLWYYEKRLYGDLGAKRTADISYEEAATQIATELRGTDGQASPDRLEQSVLGDQVFNQSDDVRGYYEPGRSLIRLTEASDLSTFLHEFAHFMYETELKTNGEKRGKINQWFERNKLSVANEAGVNPADVTLYLGAGSTNDERKDQAIRRATHEQFARGFEKYLMEGTAPSVELRNVFRTISRWLSEIYRMVRGDLKVDLDEEMREVFDRLLATEEQLEIARLQNEATPMFTDATMAGMTEEEFTKYKERQQRAIEKQSETLRDKLLKEYTRNATEKWNSEKDIIKSDIRDEVENEPIHTARRRLNSGDIKLDHASVKAVYGREVTDKRGVKSTRIPGRLNKFTVKGGEGLNPDIAAVLLGFKTGDDLIRQLLTAKDVETVIDERAQSEMIKRYGDTLNDGTLQAKVNAALVNEERGQVILSELQQLRRLTNQRGPNIGREAIKAEAYRKISELSYSEIQPSKYRRAEVKAAHDAGKAFAAGDRELAAAAKLRQLQNFYLSKAAQEARDDTDKKVRNLTRYNKQKVIAEVKKGGNNYWDQMERILTRFEFRPSATKKGVNEYNESLQAWAKQREEVDGDLIILNDAVLDESYVSHWKDVPYGDLVGVHDTLVNIEHVARHSRKVQLEGERMDYEEVVARWTTHMDKNSKTRFNTNRRSNTVEKKSFARMAMAGMTKVPYLASWLDGGERVGLSHEIMMGGLNKALADKLDLWKTTALPVVQAIKSRSKEDQKRHLTMYTVPEIATDDDPGILRGDQILSVALNTGNAGNLKKMLIGEGWANPDDPDSIDISNPKLQAVLKYMTKQDWDLVQMIWDQMDTLYPALADVYEKSSGLRPPKVKAVPVKTKFGTYKGGYYPVVYDATRDIRSELNEEKENAQLDSMFSAAGFVQASVTTGSTEARTGYTGPIRLNLDVVPNHFNDVIHYITHHEPVRQLNKLFRDNRVMDMIKKKMGPDEASQLRPWLNDVAKDGRQGEPKTYIDRVMQRLRFGTTLVTMGFSASTGLMQLLGLSNAIGEVGVKNFMQSFRAIFANGSFKEGVEFAMENSNTLRHRAKTMDREMKNVFNELQGEDGMLAKIQNVSMRHIAYIQLYAVDIPTWYAAYIKGMKDHGDERRAMKYGDWAVENVQGSGSVKDMAAIMRSKAETLKILTMFMTFFSSLWNMQRDLKKGQHDALDVASRLTFMLTLPVIIEALMKEKIDDEDEPEEQLQTILTEIALYNVASVPVARDVASGLISDFGYNFSPIAQIIETGTRATPQVIEALATGETPTKAQVKGATKFAGTVLKVPGVGQAWKSYEHLYDVLENGEDPEAMRLLLGPVRD